ncbi:hypothetical protein CACET_c00850 [Clostridium aceticum]|uniref:Uncharacterized protein n=1 Tax=Clostridium aceticum TaxID=84022 RepID=A0A0D8IAX9_9CLOT|nr:hypothetical protein [Clostridium aceticum]AKL93603.1 hypothetical protein CACET_c00850 [Clostridium aceticum]KJF27192.1 hypothetical protein TZ02_08955 [Clostridium aceticum]
MKKNQIAIILAFILVFSMTTAVMADTSTIDVNHEEAIDVTQEGMTATEMLEKASEELLGFKTMNYILDMDMKSHVIERAEEGLKEADMIIHMLQEGAVDLESNKVYVVSTSKAMAGEEEIDTVTELFIDNYDIYMKFPGTDQWLKSSIDPMMQELQALLGTNIENNVGISKQQMALFGMRATYLPEEKINGEEYYVVLLTVDKEAFKAAADEIIKATVEITQQLIKAEEVSSEEEEEMRQEIETMVKELIYGMDMEIEYTCYIHKDTKNLEKMGIVQRMNMMSGIVEIHTTSTGTFKYYAFDEEISFPNIPQEEIIEGLLVNN